MEDKQFDIETAAVNLARMNSKHERVLGPIRTYCEDSGIRYHELYHNSLIIIHSNYYQLQNILKYCFKWYADTQGSELFSSEIMYELGLYAVTITVN